jgi:hypothetical protein
MKGKILTAIALLTSITLATPTAVFSQPNKRPNSYAAGFWQPKAQVNPSRPITVMLLNQTGMPVNYSLSLERDRVLPPGGTTNINIGSISRISDIANINIYAADELIYDYNADRNSNLVMVRIRPAGSLTRSDKAVYIDEEGRVYSF